MERLQKVIANRGFCSRRKAEELIKAGKVYVDSKCIKELGIKVNESAHIVIDGVVLSTPKKEYYLLNKPEGYICSLNDEKGRRIITDLIDTKERIYPVGRLDYDTTGLIILTNDGELANLLMHPRSEVEKVYRATIDGILSVEQIKTIKNNLNIDNRKVKVTRFKVRNKNLNKNTEVIEIGIVEGRNHIVKNIFSSFGFNVIKLKRESYGFLTLDNLEKGKYRKLNLKEVHKLYSIVN